MFGVSVTYLTIFLPGINASDRASSRQYSIPNPSLRYRSLFIFNSFGGAPFIRLQKYPFRFQWFPSVEARN